MDTNTEAKRANEDNGGKTTKYNTKKNTQKYSNPLSIHSTTCFKFETKLVDGGMGDVGIEARVCEAPLVGENSELAYESERLQRSEWIRDEKGM